MLVLKQGSSGPDVKDLQQKLKDIGFDPHGVDGHFGPGTTAAVIAFQHSKGLQADGIAGPATIAALQAASGISMSNTGAATSNTGASDVSTGGEAPSDTQSGTAAGAAPATAPDLNLAALVGKVPDVVLTQIPEAAAKFGITTNLRLAHFLAQCALESMNFMAVAENLNYSAQRLLQIFPK